MAKDQLTYSDAVRAAAADAAAALGKYPEAVRPQKDNAAPRKRPDVQLADAQTITTLEACVADLRSLLAKSEERAAEERSRCDRLIAETLVANARAAHLEGELTALRSHPAPWWRRWRQASGA
jgi:hypothetical protein